MSRCLGITLLVSLLLATPAAAATLYVATNGNDRNSGSRERPLRSISHAAKIAKPGDVVLVRGGTYSEIVLIESKGTAAAPIAFRAAKGETVVIDGSALKRADLVQLTDVRHVEFSGFTVRNSKRIGISAWGAQNTRIEYNVVQNADKAGIWAGHDVVNLTRELVVAHNRVENCVLENRDRGRNFPRGGWAQAIGIFKSRDVEVRNNYVFRNFGEGIVFVMSDHGVARDNEVFDNFSFEIYLDNAQSIEVDRNLLYSTGDERYFRRGHPPAGIGLANESYGSDSNPLYDITITNNVVLKGRWGFYYGNFERGGGMHKVRVANNTFYGATDALVRIDRASHTDVIVERNIFTQTSAPLHATVGGTVTFRANNWSGGDLATARRGPGDVTGDPRFTNAGGLEAAHYRLRSDSPLRTGRFGAEF